MCTVLMALTSMAQGRMELRFNEVMVVDSTNYVDTYGNHAAWVEIFNRSYGTVNMEQMFLSTKDLSAVIKDVQKSERKVALQTEAQKNPGVVYEVPRGDKDSRISPRGYAVFFIDGKSTLGTMHTSFAFNLGSDNELYLYDVNGDLVDHVVIPATLPSDQSFSLKTDGKSEGAKAFDAQAWVVRNGSDADNAITPARANPSDETDNIEAFKKNDGNGIKLTLIAMGIVFSALLLLSICFMVFGSIFKASDKKQSQAKANADDAKTHAAPVAATAGDDDEGAIVAICMAMYQHFNAHDEESGILTFNRETHTDWTNKGGMMPHMPIEHVQ